ncbi:uncharacterized protein LOC143041658 [Oratosquilla oratoria]|uniref:uncharacterized protein LOC143041658 n=1 Tax=Oratosquilla oratoria TaxID=337810 RepID=UPI003F7629FD
MGTGPPEEDTKTMPISIVNPVTLPKDEGTPTTDFPLPNSALLRRAGLKIASTSSTKIGEVVRGKSKNEHNNNSMVYRIPCGGCDLNYFGETGRGIHKRTYEHKSDLRAHRTSNALVIHAEEYGHLPNWDGVEILKQGLDKKKRKIVEAAFIASQPCCNHRDGFIKLSKMSGWMILQELKGTRGREGVG